MLPLCGQAKTRSGAGWTPEKILQHQRGCKRCLEIARDSGIELTAAPRRERILDMIDTSDMPDGAYFALAHELGEDNWDDDDEDQGV